MVKLITFLKFGVIASYQGAFRLAFIATIPFFISSIDKNQLASEFSLFLSIAMVLSVSPGVYIGRIILQHKINVGIYTISAVAASFVIIFVFNVMAYYLIGEVFISWLYVFITPLFTLHMVTRNYFIYYKNENLVIISDVLFAFTFYGLFFLLYRMAMNSTIFYLLGFLLVIFITLFLYGFFKESTLLSEQIGGFNAGLSNFCSGGIVLILPVLINQINVSITYHTMLAVSVLSLIMLVPRIYLLRKTQAIARASKSLHLYKFLNLTRFILNKILTFSLFMCLTLVTLFLIYREELSYIVIISWLSVSAYFYFSQLSLFDCNVIIYRGESSLLLKTNLLVLSLFLLMSAISWCLLKIDVIKPTIASSMVIISLPILMMARFRYISSLVDK